MEVTITATGITYIKSKPQPISKLEPHQYAMCKVIKGKPKSFTICDIWSDEAGHFRIKFTPQIEVRSGDGSVVTVWQYAYIFGMHWKGITAALEAKNKESKTFSPAGDSYVLHSTPLLQQLNNKNWADWGSASNLRSGAYQCGINAAAMVLATIWPNEKVARHAMDAGGQFEDWVGGIFKKLNIKSTVMEDHVKFFKYLGFTAYARRDATISEAKEALDDLPFIGGRAFKEWGHFVAFCGYCDVPGTRITRMVPVGTMDNIVQSNRHIAAAGMIANDPYGDPKLYGSYNHYSQLSRTIKSKAGLHVLHSDPVLHDIWVDNGDASGWGVFLDPKTKNYENAPPKPVELRKAQENEGIPDGQSRITFTQDSFLKESTAFSGMLGADQKQEVSKNDVFIGVVGVASGGHITITKPGKDKIHGRDVWYVFRQHAKIETPNGISLATPGEGITKAAIREVAASLCCEEAALLAVIEVEAAGSGMLPSKRPKVLFEALYFHDFTDGRFDRSHPHISSSWWNRSLYKGGEAEWDRLNAAMDLNRTYGIGSASWGLFQIMGAHSFERDMGYTGSSADKAEQFYKENMAGEVSQLRIGARFIRSDGNLLAALQNKRWAAFARAYNGESYHVNKYDKKLLTAYQQHKK